MKRILKSVWTYVVLGVLAGLLLVTVVYGKYPHPTVLAFGDAVIVAALIGGFLHVREVSELFQSMARSTLIQDDYLRRLSEDQLRQVRSLSLRLTVEKGKNNPQHLWQDLESTIDQQVFSVHLPNEKDPKAGIYRSDYDEAIGLRFLSLREALTDAGCEVSNDLANDPRLTNVEIRKHTTATTFEVICPRDDVEVEFPYPLRFVLSDIPLFPPERRIRVMIGDDENSAQCVGLGQPTAKAGLVEFSMSTLLKVKGSKSFWIRTEEWHNAGDARFILNTMSFLTRGLTVSLSCDRPNRFGGGIFGLGKQGAPKAMDHGISLRYKSWLLEDNGYIIWWDPRGEENI